MPNATTTMATAAMTPLGRLAVATAASVPANHQWRRSTATSPQMRPAR